MVIHGYYICDWFQLESFKPIWMNPRHWGDHLYNVWLKQIGNPWPPATSITWYHHLAGSCHTTLVRRNSTFHEDCLSIPCMTWENLGSNYQLCLHMKILFPPQARHARGAPGPQELPSEQANHRLQWCGIPLNTGHMNIVRGIVAIFWVPILSKLELTESSLARFSSSPSHSFSRILLGNSRGNMS